MKKIICLSLILGLTLFFLRVGHTQDANLDTLRTSDVNADGIINILDLTLVASSFGKTIAADQVPNPDVTGDGIVNIFDLVLVAGQMGKTVRPPVAFVSAKPVAESQLEVNGTVTLTFDSEPEDLTVNAGVATIADKTVTIAGPFEPGPLRLTITWADGTQTLNYTIRPPVVFVRARPAGGETLDVDGTITLTFDRRPEDVTVSSGVAEVTGRFVDITGPFDPGTLVLDITWADGSQTLRYTVRVPDTEPPQITHITSTDSNGNIEQEPTQNTTQFEITFNETVIGRIILLTAAGTNVGWSGQIEGNKGIVERLNAEALDSGFPYRIDGTVSDAAGNEVDFTIDFTTAGQVPDIPILVNDATFDTVVLESELPVVVEFYAVW